MEEDPKISELRSLLSKFEGGDSCRTKVHQISVHQQLWGLNKGARGLIKCRLELFDAHAQHRQPIVTFPPAKINCAVCTVIAQHITVSA